MILSPVATGNGAFVVHLQLAKYLSGYELMPYDPRRTFFPPLLYSLGRDKSPDIIHTTPDYGVFHQRDDVPLVLTFHNYVLDDDFAEYGSSLQKLHWKTDLRWFHKLAVERADVITAVSQFTADLAKKDLGITKPIKVIYNGVDEQQFTPAERPSGNELKVLFSGNLTQRKGVQWLLPIIKQLDKRIIIYYTSGLRELSQLVDHPRLRPLGGISHDKMPALYREMDVLLLPTVREGFSLSVLEAMASGLPVVAWDVSSLPEQIQNDKGGILCPFGNVESIRSALVHLVDKREACREMGAFNRAEITKHFTLSKMLGNYEKLFAGV